MTDTDDSAIARLRALALAGLVLAAGLAVWVAVAKHREGSGLTKYKQLPAFQLTASDGKAWDSAQLQGKVWIASFVFTTCKNSCPMLSLQMKRLSSSLPLGDGFALVSFTVDPDHDTPARLREYAKAMGADDPRWVFLTGTKAKLKALIQGGFLLTAEPGDKQRDARGAPDILHSSKLVLVDQHGTVRGYYDGLLGSSVEAVRRDAQRLAKES